MDHRKYFIQTEAEHFSGWLPKLAGLKLEAMLWGEIFTTTIGQNGFWSVIIENYVDTDYYFASVRIIDEQNKKIWHYGFMGYLSLDLDYTNIMIFSDHHYSESENIGVARIRLILMDEFTIKSDHFTEKGWSIELPTEILKTLKNEKYYKPYCEFSGSIFLDTSEASHEIMDFWFFNPPPT